MIIQIFVDLVDLYYLSKLVYSLYWICIATDLWALLPIYNGSNCILCYADIAETSVEQCKERYDNLKKGQRGGYRESRERLFTLECLAADCTKVTSHQDNAQVLTWFWSMQKPELCAGVDI